MTFEAREEERFQRAIPASNIPRDAFANYLRRKEYEAITKDAVARPDRAQADEYRDNEDIVARKKPNGAWKYFEVKGRGFTFTCADDYLHSSILLDRVDKSTRRGGHLDWYVSVSSDLEYAAVVDGRTSDQWDVVDVYDPTRGYNTGPVYRCPASLARYVRIAE